MRISGKRSFFCFAAVAGAASNNTALAQLSLSAEISRSTLEEGNPALVSWTYTYSGVHNFQASDGDPYVDVNNTEQWDVSTSESGEFSYTTWHHINNDPDPVFQEDYEFDFPENLTAQGLFPAAAQAEFSQPIDEMSFEGNGDLASYLLMDGGADDYEALFENYHDGCYQWNEITRTSVAADGEVIGTIHNSPDAITGTTTRTMAGHCDEINLAVNSNGVQIDFSFAEDSITPIIDIAQAGISYNELGSSTTTTSTTYVVDGESVAAQDTTIAESRTREEALSAFEDYLLDSGENLDLAAALIGVPVEDLPEMGTLPQGGDFFAVSAEFTRNEGSELTQELDDPVLGDDGVVSAGFGADSLGEIVGYYALNMGQPELDFGLADFDEVVETDAGSVTITVLGVSATASKAENDTAITLISDDLEINQTFNGDTLDESADLLEAYVAANESELTENFVRAAQESDIATDSTNSVAGNPQSVQGVFNSNLLSLDTPNSLMYEADYSAAADNETGGGDTNRKRHQQDSGWMVGGRVGTLQFQEEEGVYADIVVERGFRVGEGSRNRVKISAPISVLNFDDVTQTTGTLRAGYEHQVIDGKWVVEPAVGVGYAYNSGDIAAGDFEAGALWSAGASSKFKIGGIGKGHIVIGNAIGYSESFDIEVEGAFKSADINNVTYRNGVAYQLPVGQRVFDRLGTVRASYTHTKLAGSEVAVDEYHDVSLSYGVGARESTTRNVAETFRVGLSATFGDDYESFAVTGGFRF